MKSRITSVINNRAFLLLEIMIAFSLMTLFLISSLTLGETMQRLYNQAEKNLINLENRIPELESKYVYSDYSEAWGRDNCYEYIHYNLSKFILYSQGIELGINNISTDIEVRNSIIYLTTDSSILSAPDFYIINAENPQSPYIISSIHTSPGLSSVEIASHYAYLANMSSVNQIQILDIENRENPILISTLKLPLPTASTTAPWAESIFYYKDKIYLGTKKWNGREFAIIDVSDPYLPNYLGGYETNTLINDIYVKDNLAYLATSDMKQMRILNISDPTNIVEIDSFSPSGYSVQEGKTLSFSKDIFSLGRTVGGFNNTNNHEFFLFSTTSDITPIFSKDIPGGVYNILLRPPNIYISTKSPGRELQILDQTLEDMVLEYPLSFLPNAFTCDRNTFYFATGDSKGIGILKIN